MLPPTALQKMWDIHSLKWNTVHKTWLYASLVFALLSSCALTKEPIRRNDNIPQNASTISDFEIQAAIAHMQKENPLYPLAPKNPEIQKEVNKLADDIQRDIRLERPKHSLIYVRDIFLKWLQIRCPNIEISSPEIQFIEPRRTWEGVIYCELSANIAWRTYTAPLTAKDGVIVQPIHRRTTHVNAMDIATNIRSGMAQQFLQHVRERIAIFLWGEFSKIGVERAHNDIQRVIQEDVEGFKSIGVPMEPSFGIHTEENTTMLIIKILPDGKNDIGLQFFFPKKVSK